MYVHVDLVKSYAPILCPLPLLVDEQAVVAARFLREAACPPLTVPSRAAFRDRWGPWLWGGAAGATGPATMRLVA